MKRLTKPLLELTAEDLMSRELVLLPQELSLRTAARWLARDHVSGAPVVDEAGELVGVLSASDIIKRDRAHNDEESDERRSSYYSEDPFEAPSSEYFSREEYSLDALGRELAMDWMTPEVVSVGPDATLAEICAVMAKESIHRVFVLKDKRLQGVVSTFDIVSYLAENSGGTDGAKASKGAKGAKRGRKSGSKAP